MGSVLTQSNNEKQSNLLLLIFHLLLNLTGVYSKFQNNHSSNFLILIVIEVYNDYIISHSVKNINVNFI